MISDTDKPLVLLSAGGTGGHVFPARALAEVLLERGYRVALATDQRGEKYFQGFENVPRYVLPSGGYVGGVIGKFKAGIELIKGYIYSHRLMTEIKPQIVIGFGGYPSAPPLFAAQHRKIPTILHEQNAILGLANILLAPFADTLALSYAGTGKIRASWVDKCVTVGNPVRSDIAALGRRSYPSLIDKLNILIVGGSQGARVFGTAVPYALTNLPADMRQRFSVVHQARLEDIERVKGLYADAGITAEVKNFFDDMPQRLAIAHLLITRSGASTVAELTAAGRPAIYVPFPWNRDLQQVFNAQNVVHAGGGWMVLEQNLTIQSLQQVLIPLLENHAALQQAAQAALSLGQPDAAQKLADLVREFH